MNNYLIPANSKKSQLIAGIFRPIDLGIGLCGIAGTLILALLIHIETIPMMVVKLLPAGLGILLVMPVPHYHNVLVFVREMYQFISGRRTYIWRGWCANGKYDEEN